MALSGGFTPKRRDTTNRLPGLPEDWRSQPENIDPKTGKPIKRRTARMNLGASLPGGKSTTTMPGQSTQGLAPNPAQANARGQAPQTPGATTTNVPGAGRPGGGVGSIASQSTIPGPLGTLEPHGQIAAAQDPRALYGQIMPGGSAGRAAGFYGEAFNPAALGAASGLGASMQTNQDYLAAGQALADAFSGGAGAGKYLNPVEMMGNILQYAQQVMDSVRTGKGGIAGDPIGGPLAGIASMDPPAALSAFLEIAGQALVSTMPEDVANAYIAQLERIGYSYIDQYYQNPIENDTMPGAGVINFLANQLGSTMGLAGGNAGGMGTTSAQWQQAF